LVGISEVKRLLGRPKCRWEIILQWVLGKWGGEVVDWMHVAQDRDQLRALVNTIMNLRVP